MLNWLTISGVVLLFVILEESIYYCWNRYIYGQNIDLRQKWKKRLSVLFSLFKRKKKFVIQHNHQEKSSS